MIYPKLDGFDKVVSVENDGSIIDVVVSQKVGCIEVELGLLVLTKNIGTQDHTFEYNHTSDPQNGVDIELDVPCVDVDTVYRVVGFEEDEIHLRVNQKIKLTGNIDKAINDHLCQLAEDEKLAEIKTERDY